MLEVGAGMVLFTSIILLLVLLILAARSKLVDTGTVTVLVNNDRKLDVPVGSKLLQGLADEGILVPSACAGGGSCGKCRVKVLSGGGAILPTETSLMMPPQRRTSGKFSAMTRARPRQRSPTFAFGASRRTGCGA